MADKKDKRFELIRAMMTFGGPNEAPTNYEASVLPDIPSVGRTYGIETSPNESGDDDFKEKQKQKKRQGIISSLMKNRGK